MIWTIIIITIILVDQHTKYLANTNLAAIRTYPIIQDIFHFTYVRNYGAAFGILQNQKWFFIILTSIIMIGIVYYMIRYARHAKYRRLIMLSLAMVLGGAVGNLIDRIRFGYVVDFFDFTLINYPVFNVADIFIVAGTILLSYYLLFKYEEKKDEA